MKAAKNGGRGKAGERPCDTLLQLCVVHCVGVSSRLSVGMSARAAEWTAECRTIRLSAVREVDGGTWRTLSCSRLPPLGAE